MFLEFLNRHLTVTSFERAHTLCAADKDFWNVITLLSPGLSTPRIPHAKKHFRLTFDDAENPSDDGAWALINDNDVKAAFQFAEETAPGGLLIHCAQGISRSTALTLVFIAHGLHRTNGNLTTAPEVLLEIRPESRPNALVLELGLRHFLPADEARSLAVEYLHHPVFFRNRFGADPS